jgi:exodeoxyribonuclease V alpha subunit
MTVHKSQGSEFDEVLVVLPAKESRILTRELLYTAISRSRRKVTLWSSEELLSAAISRKIQRGSALPEMLSGET